VDRRFQEKMLLFWVHGHNFGAWTQPGVFRFVSSFIIVFVFVFVFLDNLVLFWKAIGTEKVHVLQEVISSK